jgi:hypothetical protein
MKKNGKFNVYYLLPLAEENARIIAKLTRKGRICQEFIK